MEIYCREGKGKLEIWGGWGWTAEWYPRVLIGIGGEGNPIPTHGKNHSNGLTSGQAKMMSVSCSDVLTCLLANLAAWEHRAI